MRAAVELVEPGMRLGLGSGRAVWATVRRARRRRRAARARRLRRAPRRPGSRQRRGLVVAQPEQAPELDLALDGADEVTRDLAVLKGGGGALLREKLVIASARRCVIVAEAPQARRPPRRALAAPGRGRALRLAGHARCACSSLLGDAVAARAHADGSPFVTDEGHHILDCALPRRADLAALGAAVKAMTGVVEHGLFLTQATRCCWAPRTARSSGCVRP